MRVTFLGVRGSTPAPGADFVRFGGHTSCVALAPTSSDVPTLLLDAGTGIRAASGLLRGGAFRGSILVSHLHWDHVMGLPFFAGGDRDDSEVDVHVPAQGGLTGRDLIAQLMSPPAFPIHPEGLVGTWRFHATAAGSFEAAGFEVTAFDVAHKGGRTYGYRVAHSGVSMAYVPDHAPAAGVSDEAMAGLAGVDLLVHDAQFIESERARAEDYGHATVDDAVRLAARAGVGRLVLFHHGPHRTDDALERIGLQVDAAIPVTVAAEGHVIDLA